MVGILPNIYSSILRNSIYVHKKILSFFTSLLSFNFFISWERIRQRSESAKGSGCSPSPNVQFSVSSSFRVSSAKLHLCRRHFPAKTFLKPILKNIDTHHWYSYRVFQHQLWRSRGFLMKQHQGVDRYLLYKSNKRHLRAARAETRSDRRAGCRNSHQNFPMI